MMSCSSKSCLFSISEASLPLTSIQLKRPLVSFLLALAITLFGLMVAGLHSSGFVNIAKPSESCHDITTVNHIYHFFFYKYVRNDAARYKWQSTPMHTF